MSLSAEMKDFIAAYKTGQGINASRTNQDYKEANTARITATTERENDPATLKLATDTAQARLDKIRDSMKSSAAARGATGARTQLINEQLKILRDQQKAGSGLDPRSYGGAPVPQGQGALPIGPSSFNPDVDINAPPAVDPRAPRLFEGGGLVPEDDEEDELLAAEPEGALPLDAAAPAGAPTDVSAQSRRQPQVPRGLEGVISPALVADATKAGMTFGLNQYGLGGRGAVPSARSAANARLFAQGHGGLTEQEMQAARQTVDPEGKLTDSQRNMAALGSVYQFWANKGEPEKAQRVAFQMLQYYRNASQRYAAIAAKAAEGGNMDLATKAAVKAYANVPDGNDLQIMKAPNGGLMYSLTNEKGETVRKGIATPQQLAASAMGLAVGGFDKAILQAAGAREDTGALKTKGGGGRPQSAIDREKEAELPATAVAALKKKWAEKNKGAPPDDTFWEEATNTAQGLMQQNPKLNANQAAIAAEALLRPGQGKDGASGFKAVPDEDGGSWTVQFPNKTKVKLSDEQLEVILNSRAASIKAAADKKAANEPGYLSKAGGILKDIGGLAANAVSEDVGRAAKQVGEAVSPETAARAKSALSAAARMGGDAGAYIMDLIKKDLSGEGGITPERVGRDIVGAAGAVGDLFKNKGAIPVDEVGPAP